MHKSGLPEILVFLFAAVLIVAVFKRLKLSPVLGYLAAGGAIGPYGLSIVKDLDTTKYIAEFGIVFLLFAIGLELTFDRLKAMRLHVFGFGSAQVVLSGTIIGLTAYFLGVGAEAAIVIGGGLALSSTAIVLKVLDESGEQATQVGRLALAVLILQDLAVVPLLIFVQLLGQENKDLVTVIFNALTNAVIVLVAIVVVGKGLLRPIFQAIASTRSEELFIATTLLLVLGAAWATEVSGLSLALGAFVAGLLVAETEFRHQVESDIKPFKGLLLGLFFMTVGMQIDFKFLQDKIVLVAIMTVALIFGKAIVVALLARVAGFRQGSSIQAGLLLSQGSEFAFVLFGLAAANAVFKQELTQLLLVTVTVTMALTPLLSYIGKNIVRRIERRNPVHLEPDAVESEALDLHNHIIVAGYGRVGKVVCSLLKAEKISNYIAVDSDPKAVHEGRKSGDPVYFGTADKIDILKAVGADRAKMIVVAIREKKPAERTVRAIHKNFPKVPIVTRAWDRAHADELREAGATVAIAESFESSLILGTEILKKIGIPEAEIARVIEKFRIEEYPISLISSIFHIEAKKVDS